MSVLEDSAEARAAFERMNRHARSGFRQAFRLACVEMPSWAQDKRIRNLPGSDERLDSGAQCHSAATPDESDEALNAMYS